MPDRYLSFSQVRVSFGANPPSLSLFPTTRCHLLAYNVLLVLAPERPLIDGDRRAFVISDRYVSSHFWGGDFGVRCFLRRTMRRNYRGTIENSHSPIGASTPEFRRGIGGGGPVSKQLRIEITKEERRPGVGSV